MKQINEELGTTFIFSTHDPRVMEMAGRVVRLDDGELVPQSADITCPRWTARHITVSRVLKDYPHVCSINFSSGNRTDLALGAGPGSDPPHKDSICDILRCGDSGKAGCKLLRQSLAAGVAGERNLVPDVGTEYQRRHLRLKLEIQAGRCQPEALYCPASIQKIVQRFGGAFREDNKMCGTCKAGYEIQLQTWDQRAGRIAVEEIHPRLAGDGPVHQSPCHRVQPDGRGRYAVLTQVVFPVNDRLVGSIGLGKGEAQMAISEQQSGHA